MTLEGYWPLHDDQARDLSGNGNHGTLNGGITTGVAGKAGLQAMSFDGSDDYIGVSSRVLSTGQDQTFSLWFRYDGTGGRLLEMRDNFRMWLAVGSLVNSSSGELSIRVTNNGDATTYGTGVYPSSNEWNHVAVKYDNSATTWTVYYNGSQVFTVNTGDTVDDPNNSNYISTPNGPWSGSITDVRIYSRKLTDAEIRELYQKGSADYVRPPNDGIAHYKLDGDAKDAWWKNDGATNGGLNFTDNAVRGQAANFDGSDDYITAGNLGSIYSGGFSFSVWFRTDSNHNGIFVSADDESSGTRITQFKKKSGGQLEFNFIGNGLVDTNSQPNGEWMHGVAVYRSDGTAEIYVNGVLEASGSSGISSGDPQVVLGMQEDGNGVNSLNGNLDDVRIYDYALSPSEVFELYRWGTRGKDLRKHLVNRRG